MALQILYQSKKENFNKKNADDWKSCFIILVYIMGIYI